MTVVRPQVVIAATQTPVSRKAMGASGMVIRANPAWSKKPLSLSNMPYTAFNPTPAQQAQRDRFAQAARAAPTRGVGNTGLDAETGMPVVAAHIQRTLGRGRAAPVRTSGGW